MSSGKILQAKHIYAAASAATRLQLDVIFSVVELIAVCEAVAVGAFTSYGGEC